MAYNDTTVTASHVYTYKVAPANAGGETLSGAGHPDRSLVHHDHDRGADLGHPALTVSAAMIVDWGDGNTNPTMGLALEPTTTLERERGL